MKIIYFFVLALLLTSPNLMAQDGTLDSSFGNNGTKLFTGLSEDAEILDVVKSGNQLIGVGHTSEAGPDLFSVVAFQANGSIDLNFGTNGLVTIPVTSGASKASCIIQQPDGKYLIGGWGRVGNKDLYVVVRMMEDGTLDTGFGTDGIVKGTFSSSSFAEDETAAIQLLSDGKIVITGRSYGGLLDDVFVACFNPDGSLYTDFGNNGFLIIDFGQSPADEQATALAVDGQDNIYIGGGVAVGFNEEDAFFLTKLDKFGVTDNSFGDQGKIFHIIASDVIAGLNTIALDDQGRIVTGGGAFDIGEVDNNFFLTRYLSNGTIDNSFGNNGVVILERNSNESIFDLEILSSGDIIAAGSTGGFGSRFAMVRLSTNGTHDLAFGNNGWALTLIESSFNGINGIVVEDGCVYAAGFARGSIRNMAVAKYFNQGMTPIRQLNVASDVLVFPNPTTAHLSIQFNVQEEIGLSIELADLSGRQLSVLLPQQKLPSGDQQFDLVLPNHLMSGHYLLVLDFGDGVLTKKIEYQR